MTHMAAFPARHWKGHIPCSACRKPIKTGVVAANEPTPPSAALCPACYADLMEDPEEFERVHRDH